MSILRNIRCQSGRRGFNLRNPEIPIVVISGTGDMQDVLEALHRGAWDFVTKPIQDMAVLEHAVRKALERARLRVENIDQKLVEVEHRILQRYHIGVSGRVNDRLVLAVSDLEDRGNPTLPRHRFSGVELYSFGASAVFCAP